MHAFRDLWFHTGDRGHIDDDGRIVFVDRMEDTIRRRGEEHLVVRGGTAVQRHPTIAEAAAFALPSDVGEDEVAIAVVAVGDGTIDPAELFAWCVEVLPRFAVPRYLRVVAALPKTPSQRIQKYKLRADDITADTADRYALGIVAPRS